MYLLSTLFNNMVDFRACCHSVFVVSMVYDCKYRCVFLVYYALVWFISAHDAIG